jgi:hypothetical protein
MNCKCGKPTHSKGLCSTCWSREWRKNNPDKYRAGQTKWYLKNKDSVLKKVKEYKATNPEIVKKCKNNFKPKVNNYYKQRYKNDIQFRLKVILRNRLLQSIKTDAKAGSAVKDLGCSIEEFKVYLESKFQPGMSWGNIGDWHIDHIVPLSKFDLSNHEQFRQACHYTNLQPLWAKDNLLKSDNT